MPKHEPVKTVLHRKCAFMTHLSGSNSVLVELNKTADLAVEPTLPEFGKKICENSQSK
jgi:hypothetical protein